MALDGTSHAGHRSGVLRAGLLGGLLIAGPARLAAAQDTTTHVPTTAAVAGVLRDSLGHPIMLATISADGEARRTTSDDAGRFAIRGLKPGHVSFHVLRIGYEPIAFVLDLPVDSTVHVEIRLHGTPLLQAVVVQGDAPSEKLARTGFYERRRLANGQFLTPAQVDSSVANSPSELLRAFHGIDVICGEPPTADPGSRTTKLHVLPPTTGGACTMKSRGAGCVWLFVDGHFVDAPLDAITSRAEIAAVEFYERQDDVPLELQAPTRGHPCAAVAVWTKLVAR